jgi:zinc protease
MNGTRLPDAPVHDDNLRRASVVGRDSVRRRFPELSMRRLLAAAALSTLLLASASPAALAQPRAPAAAPAKVAVPPIVFTQRALPNGMKVFSAVDRGTSNVTVQVWYGVGSKDDPQGRSGFAHLFEHLMFFRTRNMPATYLDRLTEDVGGYNNASTWDDFTNYYEVVPANHLERLLWAEADRMGSLEVDDATFRSERDVVKEEFRQGVLANPYGRLFGLALPMATFQVHPYKRPGIGNIEELNAATLSDVRAFHKTFYRPDNAALIVVGNFEQASFDRWVDAYFGPLKPPAEPLPRVTAVEPPRTGPGQVDAYGPTVPLPAVAITWLAPARSSPDAPALRVLGQILSKGDSSRLYSRLVYEQQIAQSVFGEDQMQQQPGFFAAGAIMAGGKTLDAGEAAVRAEVGRLRDQPVTPAELDKAKTQLTTSALKDRQAVDERANALGFALMWEGDAARANDEIVRIQAVSADDVQRVARKYLADDTRMVIRYRGEDQKPAGAPVWPPTPESAAEPGPAAPPPPAGPTPNPPALGAPVQAALPHPLERTLPNGLRVIVAKSTDLPLVTARLVVRAGGASDPEGKAGLADLTADLLTKGAGKRTAAKLAADVEALGAQLESAAGWDGASLDITVMKDKIDPALSIMADAARRPTLSPEELERLRVQALDGLTVALQDPGDLGGFVTETVVSAGAPYGHMLNGSPASLKRITDADVKALHAAWYRPDNAVLVLTGDLTPEEGFAFAQRHFGDWARPAAALPTVQAATAQNAPRVVVVDIPGAGQAAVTVALPGIRRSDPDYFPAMVANATLGVGFSSRLNQEIRIKRGLSYGAGSAVQARRFPGPIKASAQTKNESAPEVVDLMLAELARLRAEPAPEAELGTRKAVLTGSRGRTLETTEGLADTLASYALQDVPLSELGRFDADVLAVDPAAVRAFADRSLDPAKANIIVVGDARLFIDQLRAKHPDVELIKGSEIDLDRPQLRPAAP